MKTGAKKIGRPPKAPEEGERLAMAFRVTAATKRKLAAAADREGRSQSQEAEFRLEASFKDEQLLEGVLDRLYGRCVSGLLMGIGLLAKEIAFNTRPGAARASWGETDHLFSHPYAFDQFATAVKAVLEDPRLRPAGEPTPTAKDVPNVPSGHGAERDAELMQLAQRIGEQAAAHMLEDLSDPIKRRSAALAPISERLKGAIAPSGRKK